jgi:Fe2+ transport system protein FeoA
MVFTMPVPSKKNHSLPDGASTLAAQSKGTCCKIVQLLNTEAELTLLRFGLGVGDTVCVLSKVPNKGPLILEAHDMEFALGYDYASSILVDAIRE